jgi:hypothetical protein
MDALGFLVVTIPIFFPLAAALGYDPVWYTVVLTIVTTMGAVTPPVGVNVFIVNGLAPEIPIHTIFRGGDSDPHDLPGRGVFPVRVRSLHRHDVGVSGHRARAAAPASRLNCLRRPCLM